MTGWWLVTKMLTKHLNWLNNHSWNKIQWTIVCIFKYLQLTLTTGKGAIIDFTDSIYLHIPNQYMIFFTQKHHSDLIYSLFHCYKHIVC